MPTVHAAFDPQTRTWFVIDPPAEAPTIPELLKKLAKGNRIKWAVQDYFPNSGVIEPLPPGKSEKTGWRVSMRALVRPKEPPKERAAPSAPVVANPTPVAAPPRVRGPIVRKWEKRHKFRAWDPEKYEKALDMWAAGVKGNVIAEKLGLTRLEVCSHMVPNARAHGDPRAVVRASHYGRKRSLCGDQGKKADLPVLGDRLGD